MVLNESTAGFALTLTNKIDLNSASRTIAVNTPSIGTLSATVSGVISNSGASTAGLTKTGVGRLILTGANTYNGTTTVSTGGVLNIQNADALGSTAAGTVVQAGAALQIQGDITTAAEALTINGTGIVNNGNNIPTTTTGYVTIGTLSASITNTTGALRNISGTNTYSGAVTLGSASRIQSDAGTLTLGAGVTGSNVDLTVGGAGNTSITAITTGTGTLTMQGNAGATAGTLTLTGASTYTGNTTVRRGNINLTGSINGATGTALDFTGAGMFQVSNVSQNMGALTTSNGDGTVASVWTSGTIAQTFTSLNARTAGVTRSFITTGGVIGTDNKIVLSGQAAGFMGIGTFANSATEITTADRYAYYDGGGFVRAYSAGDANYLAAPSGTTIGASTSSSNIDLTSGNITAQTTATANTITMRGYNITMTGTSPVLSTDGLLSTGSGAATLGGGTTPILQPATAGGELVVRVNGSTDLLTVTSVIQDNTSASSLTKSGAGTLSLTTMPTYTGTTTVAGGILKIAGTLPSAAIVVDSGEIQPTSGSPDYYVGNTSANNSLTIQNGGKMSNFKGLYIGNGSTSSGNSVTIDGVGSAYLTGVVSSGAFFVGLSGDDNSLTIQNGGYFRSQGSGGTTNTQVGLNSGSDGNSIRVTGAGSTLSMLGQRLVIGAGGGSETKPNTLTVSAGGQVLSRVGQIGGDTAGTAAGSYNKATVEGAGSLWSMTEDLTVGRGTGASNNGVIVQDGGTLYTRARNDRSGIERIFEIGSTSTSANNYITVKGSGSQWIADPGNSAVVTNTGIMTGVIGLDAAATGNTVNVQDGGSWAMNWRLELGGIDSAVNLGNGIAKAKSFGAFQDLVMNTASARVNINNGELKFSKDLAEVSGLGQVVLNGPAYISTPTGFTNTISTAISGTGDLIKEGAGTLVLSNASVTYSGNTSVNEGILDVTASGGLTIGSGKSLKGGGTIIGAVSVAGTLAPGNSIESLAMGALSMTNNSIFAYEYNSAAGVLAAVAGDLVKVTGDVTLTGKVTLNLADLAGGSAGAFATGTVLSLINYSGTLSGLFSDGTASLAEGGSLTLGGNTWTINYSAISSGSSGANFLGDYFADSKFVTLTSGSGGGDVSPVPEPGSLLALGLLVGSGAFLRNRRRR